MALYGVIFLGSTPVGAPIVGWAGQQFGPRAGFALGGIAAVAAGITGLWLARTARLGAGAAYAPSVEPVADAVSSGMRSEVVPLPTSTTSKVAYQPGS